MGLGIFPPMNDPESVFEADLSADARDYSRYEKLYLVLAAAFVTCLVLTNIIGIKLFAAPHDPKSFALTTGLLTYPVTFLITDIVSEIYGKKRADFMVLLGFGMSLLMLGIVQVAIHVPAHAYWVPGANAFYDTVQGYQHAFESVFSVGPKLVFGSMLAYLCAQLCDNYLFHWWKRKTDGKHLWLRNNGSTWISQLVDTAIVNSILFYWGFGWEFWKGVQVMATIYVYKLIIAALDTPLVYLGVYAVKRNLGLKTSTEETAPLSAPWASKPSRSAALSASIPRNESKSRTCWSTCPSRPISGRRRAVTMWTTPSTTTSSRRS